MSAQIYILPIVPLFPEGGPGRSRQPAHRGAVDQSRSSQAANTLSPGGGRAMTPIQKIHVERRRQIEQEGWTSEHDDTHSNGEMLTAAVIYYQHAIGNELTLRADGAPLGWPWEAQWWKPKGRERDLVRAGALCLAERERLRRIPAYTGHVNQKLSLIADALDGGTAKQLNASHRPEGS
jgi:hypothetical protein